MKPLAIVTLCLAVSAQAQRTVHAPLAAQLPLGTRTAAMGGGNAASRDAEAALSNPALAGAVAGLGVSVVRYRAGTAGGVVGNSSSVGAIGVGVAVSYLDYAPVPGAGQVVSDAPLIAPGQGTAGSLHAAVALSTTYKGIRWGMAGTYLEERVEAARSGVATVSVGAAKTALFGFASFGIALQNLGPAMALVGDNAPLPARLAVGASGAQFPLNAWFDLGVDLGAWVRRDGLAGGVVGAELAYVPIEGLAFALRGGARRPELKAQGPATLGLGATLDRFSLDYAWEQMRSGGAHRLGIRVR